MARPPPPPKFCAIIVECMTGFRALTLSVLFLIIHLSEPPGIGCTVGTEHSHGIQSEQFFSSEIVPECMIGFQAFTLSILLFEVHPSEHAHRSKIFFKIYCPSVLVFVFNASEPCGTFCRVRVPGSIFFFKKYCLSA